MFQVNDPILFFVAGMIIFYVLLQSILFLVKALKRAAALNMDKKGLQRVMISSALFTIAPAVSILLGLITLSKFLGLPLPWLRLSVLGALTYELPAATAAASTMDISVAGTITDKFAYATIAWVMTIGILSGIVMVTFFMPQIQKGIKKLKSKDDAWGKILMDALFIGMISAFLGMIFANVRKGKEGLIPVILMGVSSLVMILCGVLVKKCHIKWLENYALPISMLVTMVTAIPLTALLKGGLS